MAARTAAKRAGLRVGEFSAAIGLSRSKLYDLPPEMQPRSVFFGRARIVIEPPAAYLRRIAEIQDAPGESS